MKKLLYVPLMLTILALAVGCGSGEEAATNDIPTTVTEKEVPAGSEMVYTASIGIEGMTCSQMCASTIESKLAAMEGVSNCKVEEEGKTAYVEYDNDAVNEDAMVGTITEIAQGQYQVTSVAVERPVASESAPVSNADESTSEDETALNVQAPVIKVPNIFDLFTRLYRL